MTLMTKTESCGRLYYCSEYSLPLPVGPVGRIYVSAPLTSGLAIDLRWPMECQRKKQIGIWNMCHF